MRHRRRALSREHRLCAPLLLHAQRGAGVSPLHLLPRRVEGAPQGGRLAGLRQAVPHHRQAACDHRQVRPTRIREVQVHAEPPQGALQQELHAPVVPNSRRAVRRRRGEVARRRGDRRAVPASENQPVRRDLQPDGLPQAHQRVRGGREQRVREGRAQVAADDGAAVGEHGQGHAKAASGDAQVDAHGRAGAGGGGEQGRCSLSGQERGGPAASQRARRPQHCLESGQAKPLPVHHFLKSCEEAL
mmetsp:Transcript_785/g.2010  ORF Transcript_785/g.2010 Transcript_785/m.2010 type:complete len:245 (+) Transcript_785:692-1426(+)